VSGVSLRSAFQLNVFLSFSLDFWRPDCIVLCSVPFRDILVWIRILGSVPLTNGSGSGSGSCSFRQ